jgi:hypothetical protein
LLACSQQGPSVPFFFMTSLWIFLRKYATESIEEYDRLYYVTVLSIFDLTSQAVESTCKHNILLSCTSPNASNVYGVFLFVAINSPSMYQFLRYSRDFS